MFGHPDVFIAFSWCCVALTVDVITCDWTVIPRSAGCKRIKARQEERLEQEGTDNMDVIFILLLSACWYCKWISVPKRMDNGDDCLFKKSWWFVSICVPNFRRCNNFLGPNGPLRWYCIWGCRWCPFISVPLWHRMESENCQVNIPWMRFVVS